MKNRITDLSLFYWLSVWIILSNAVAVGLRFEKDMPIIKSSISIGMKTPLWSFIHANIGFSVLIAGMLGLTLFRRQVNHVKAFLAIGIGAVALLVFFTNSRP